MLLGVVGRKGQPKVFDGGACPARRLAVTSIVTAPSGIAPVVTSIAAAASTSFAEMPPVMLLQVAVSDHDRSIRWSLIGSPLLTTLSSSRAERIETPAGTCPAAV